MELIESIFIRMIHHLVRLKNQKKEKLRRATI